MKKICLLFITLLLLTGCNNSADQASTESSINEKETKTAESQGDGEADADIQWSDGTFDIQFRYKNNVYGYDLEANWDDVTIKRTGLNLLASLGAEVLLDGTSQAFSDLDGNNSGTVSRSEWAEYEADFPFDGINENNDDEINLDEFGHFTAQLNGVELFPTSYSISQPKQEEYGIELEEGDGPVSMKILRAGEGGFKAASGVSFPEDTIFIELQSEFEICLIAMPDFELGGGFSTPLLSMFIEEDYEKNNHGAWGFSSVVDTEEFARIFKGEPFVLEYTGIGETGTLDEYYLTIMPKN